MTSYFEKMLKKKRYYALALFLSGFVWVFNMADLRLSDHGLVEDLMEDAPEAVAIQIHRDTVNNQSLRYVEYGQPSDQLIVFVHGAPASSSFWTKLMKDEAIRSKAHMIAVDRPGYGYSDLGEPVVSVAKQAAYVAGIIEKYRSSYKSIIVHGSSYGGTVSARLAMDFPDLIDGLLLQSASMLSGAEKTYWITHPTSQSWLKWIVPKAFQTANAEKLSHGEELSKMADKWQAIKAKTIILHGLADELIYPENAEFAASNINSEALLDLEMVPESGHDLMWTKYDLLVKSLRRLLAVTQS